MHNKLVVIGAGGHGKVIADIAVKNGYTEIEFIDDNVVGMCMGFPIVGTCDILQTYEREKTDFIIAVGNNNIRKEIASKYDMNWVTLKHPSCQIASDVKIGRGTVVMAGGIINSSTQIGEHCIINTAAVVEHDNVLESFVHISPKAALGGTVHVGEKTHIGIGAVVKNNINICKGCTIGAGATVVRDILISGTYIGTPAHQCDKQSIDETIIENC